MKNVNVFYGLLIGTCLSASAAFAVPSLSINNTSAAPGTAVNVTISMTADGAMPVSGLQFDMALPTGFTFVSASTGTSSLAADKSVTGSLASGAVRTIIFGLNQTVMGTGSVAIIRLSIASNVTPGSKPLVLTNVVVSDPNGNSITGTQLTGGSVNVLDIVSPTTPTGFTAVVVSSTRVNLAWTASTDNLAVTGYRIVRNGVFLTSTTATSFANSGLTPSTTYAYTVAAFDAAGNISGTASATAVTASPPDSTAPSVPTNVAAVAVSSTRVNVSWTASTDNVGVAGYRLVRNGVFLTSTTVTNFANSGLTPSTNYSYTVAAFDAAGNLSAPSAAAAATTLSAPDNTAPSVPTNVAAVAVSSTQVNLSWTASTDNVAVTGYRIVRNGVFLTSTTVTSFANSGLTPSTNYSYTVAAYDSAGNISAPSTAAAATTLSAPDNTAPSLPTNVAAVAVSSTRVNVSWTASTDNVAVTGYRIVRNGVFLTSTTVTSFANSGLTPSTNYSYTVAAFDAAGNISAPSAASAATTLPAPDTTAPSVPTNVAAVAVSSTQVNLSWTASTDNVGVTGYRIVRNGVFLTSTTLTSFANSGLTPSTNYSYTVAAYDAAGNISAPSTAASALTLNPTDNTAPTVPSNVAAVAVSSTRVNVSWTASTDNVGVTGYQLLRNGVQISSVTSGTSFANSGLTPLTLYSYTVRAFDAAGNISAASSAASATTLGDRCDMNTDGSVNAVDLQTVANAILAGSSPTPYDLNRDTLVNVVDIQLLINVILLTGSCPQ